MATDIVSESSMEFIDTLINGSEDELNELKAFLFKENIRIDLERKELMDLKQKIFEERERLRLESDEVNRKIVIERKRLKEEQIFFDKKMEILKNGFEALEADRKALTNARRELERDKNTFKGSSRKMQSNEFAINLFMGVNSYLGLKKRYKDLLKIFHPDNMNGDHEMILAINQVYDDLKKNYESSKIV